MFVICSILDKNQFSSHLVNSIVKQYLSKFFASTSRASTVTSPNETHTHYYKLPFVGPFSSIAQHRITQRLCKNLEIKLVFASYKIKDLFSVKDVIPVWFTNFLAQAVALAMLARQTDILLQVFVNT